jgi:hypothetical protein
MSYNAKPMPPVEVLRELFRWDEQTGEIWWRVSRGRQKAGTSVGSLGGTGYLFIGIKWQGRRQIYGAHRIMWKLVHGEDPLKDTIIDHRNQIRTDNSIGNLRAVGAGINRYNQKLRSDNTSGCQGVGRNKRGWEAQLGRKRKYFQSLRDAVDARTEWVKEVMNDE